ncbi:13078_t:CDS:2, partial [Acaulospora colombiana]
MPFNQTFDEFPFLYASASQPQYPSSSSSIGVNTHITPGGFSVPAQYDSLFDGASAAGSEDGKMLREQLGWEGRQLDEACAAKDKGERPFACDGKCGTPDCGCIYLKKNIARHRKQHCLTAERPKTAYLVLPIHSYNDIICTNITTHIAYNITPKNSCQLQGIKINTLLHGLPSLDGAAQNFIHLQLEFLRLILIANGKAESGIPGFANGPQGMANPFRIPIRGFPR